MLSSIWRRFTWQQSVEQTVFEGFCSFWRSQRGEVWRRATEGSSRVRVPCRDKLEPGGKTQLSLSCKCKWPKIRPGLFLLVFIYAASLVKKSSRWHCESQGVLCKGTLRLHYTHTISWHRHTVLYHYHACVRPCISTACTVTIEYNPCETCGGKAAAYQWAGLYDDSRYFLALDQWGSPGAE